jgi:hypothetical protein
LIPSTAHVGAPSKETLMKTSIESRAAALVASILVTAGMVFAVSGYAYPEAAAVVMASRSAE